MRRAFAWLLLAALSFPLIGGLFADPDSNLPSCCRRSGEHHCAMAGQWNKSNGPAITSPAKCLSWPKGPVQGTHVQNSANTPNVRSNVLAASAVIAAGMQIVPFVRPTESIRKRGPPSLLS